VPTCEQIKPGNPRGLRVSELRRGTTESEEDEKDDDAAATQEEGFRAAAQLQPMRRSSRRAAQTSSFAISDEEDELNSLDFCNGPLGRRVKRCGSGMVLPRNNRHHFESSHNFSNYRAVPLFQMFGHLPVFGEEAGAGLLLETLVLMRELQHIRRTEALDWTVAPEELAAAAENKQVLEGKAEALPPPPPPQQEKTDAIDDQSSTPPPSVDTAVAAHEWQDNSENSLFNTSGVDETEEEGPFMEIDKSENLPVTSGFNEAAIGS